MNLLNRTSIRSVLPIVISLVLVSLAFGLLASASASASNHPSPIDLPPASGPLKPQAGSILPIPVGTIPVSLDGKCGEYSDASSQ
ncbi:MAG TPA: hypothetical protein VFK30_09895, partial [Anaerolineae bacterium]|nr:hypothetical protein [Anaerolineae bacterium]